MNTENREPLQPHSENQPQQNNETLEVTPDIQNQLTSAGGWAKFLAILGFVFMGMMVLAGFFISVALAVIPKHGFSQMPFPPFLLGIFYVVMAAVYILPILYLYRFSQGIKKALQLKDQNQFARAFFNLKAHYRFIGILMIVMLALYPIIMAVFIFAQFFHGFSGMPGMNV